MSFNWYDYLEIARELEALAPGSVLGEAKMRSAISRAYYALFCSAKNYLVANRPFVRIPPSGDAHTVVKDAFLDDSDPQMITIGVALDRLRRHRRIADYEDTFTGLEQAVAFSINTAEVNITRLNNL